MGCRRTRVAVDGVLHFSTCHPLRSTGITRLQHYYEMIRLLIGHRNTVADVSTTCRGPEEISLGKNTKLPAAVAPITYLPRLDIGRHVPWHADPDRPACAGVHLRSMLRFDPSFHSTPPRGFTIPFSLIDPGVVSAVAVHVQFPPVGLEEDFHL